MMPLYNPLCDWVVMPFLHKETACKEVLNQAVTFVLCLNLYELFHDPLVQANFDPHTTLEGQLNTGEAFQFEYRIMQLMNLLKNERSHCVTSELEV